MAVYKKSIKCYLLTLQEIVALGLDPHEEPHYVCQMNDLARKFKNKQVIVEPLSNYYTGKFKRYNCQGYTWDERWLRFSPQQLEFDFS